MERLATLQVEAIKEHLRLVPKDMSPNKDYMIGLMRGIELAYSECPDGMTQEMIDILSQPYEPEGTLEDEDFVRTTS